MLKLSLQDREEEQVHGSGMASGEPNIATQKEVSSSGQTGPLPPEQLLTARQIAHFHAPPPT
ncbi:MAG: hypothetical protein CBE00_03910 [Planctomycetaceae bacterium TMED240]|nr:hypothetical protein [Rhodopirellula sp.]OUX07802.1 MAG: hypothetical protein CBE00_03910 [Planctomycetaceae bacterium TMED240]